MDENSIGELGRGKKILHTLPTLQYLLWKEKVEVML